MLRALDGAALTSKDWEHLFSCYHDSLVLKNYLFNSPSIDVSSRLRDLIRANKIIESNEGPVHVVSYAQTAPTTWRLKTGQHLLAHLLEMNSSYALCLAHHLTPNAIDTMTQEDIRSILTVALNSALVSPEIVLNLVDKLKNIPEDLVPILWVKIGRTPKCAVNFLIRGFPFYMNGRLSHLIELALINKDEAMIERLIQGDVPYNMRTEPHILIILMRCNTIKSDKVIHDRILKDESIPYSQTDLDACLVAAFDYDWRLANILDFLFAKGAQYTPSGDTDKYWKKMLDGYQDDRLMEAYANGLRLTIDGQEADLVLWLIQQNNFAMDRFAKRFLRQYPPSGEKAAEYLNLLLQNHQYWTIDSDFLADLQSFISDTTSVWKDLIHV